MKFICSLVVVEDLTRSRYFYEEILKQKVKYDFGENVVYHGDFSIHLKSHFRSLIGNKDIITGSHSTELYFEEDDIESVVENLVKHKVEFLHNIMEQPWRQRVVRFYDPDHTIIEIGETMEHLSFRLSQEGMSINEIADITNMGEEFIEKALRQFG